MSLGFDSFNTEQMLTPAAAPPGACCRHAPRPARCDLRVFHDNATAESRHRKGSSSHEGECRFLVFAHRRLVEAGVTVRTSLVPSACMVADRDSDLRDRHVKKKNRKHAS
eukprot:Rhum_TRINITY_DN15473_c3_g1::Rhum_TRINITY_DN15473_c3_g1_i13::g.158356::m.158356